MRHSIRLLNSSNIDALLEDFTLELADIGKTTVGLTGVPLLLALKRERIGHGPYPHVTMFEAANRIMTDLVILHGVRGLLNCKALPFDEYTVEFGNEDKNGFDIRAVTASAKLVGEAFNVAPSFFQVKKSSALKKLRAGAEGATYRVVMFNSDAVSSAYSARTEAGLLQVAVDISASTVTIKPSGLESA